jgi:hypothetical protein
MNFRSHLKIIPIVLLAIMQALGSVMVGRSAPEPQGTKPDVPSPDSVLSPFSCSSDTFEEVPEKISSVSRDELIRMIQLLVRHAKTEDRCNDIKKIVVIGKPAVALLMPLLKDKDQFVQSVAIQSLSAIGESAKSAIPDLIPLLKDQNRWIRANAAIALGSFRESQ